MISSQFAGQVNLQVRIVDRIVVRIVDSFVADFCQEFTCIEIKIRSSLYRSIKLVVHTVQFESVANSLV